MKQVQIPFSGKDFERKLLHWAATFPYALWLDSCGTHIDAYGQYEFLLGIQTNPEISAIKCEEDLRKSLDANPFAWRFGLMGYEYKDVLFPKFAQSLPGQPDFPPLNFFEADLVISKAKGSDWIVFEQGFEEKWLAEILAQELPRKKEGSKPQFRSNFDQTGYEKAVQALRMHIEEGDCYEINLSQCFSASHKLDSPALVWEKMVAISPTPFAGFAKWQDKFLLCASPERFLKLSSGKLITQPIKGTIARGNDAPSDQVQAELLRNSEKEQAENVMIVDLSRNDLHRSCIPNSVTVPKLFELQQFPTLWHLVSTIEGQKRADVHPLEAIGHTFPPGSMTGAPKMKSCELISKYENLARGPYAGSLGYFAPGGDFDFNVVIRSVFYDEASEKLTFNVGGAITWDSDPAAEYQESMLKAKGIFELFDSF